MEVDKISFEIKFKLTKKRGEMNMKAIDFEFDNKRLSDFGFIICKFGSDGLNTVSNGSKITFNTVSSLGGSKHHLISTQYDDCLEATIQICKFSCGGDVTEISSSEFRNLTKWLNRKKFLKFKIFDEDYIDLYFEASFNINKIELDGKLYGLELEVVTNRPFALKESKTILIENTNESKNVHTWEKYDVIRDYEIIKGEIKTTKPDDCLTSTYTNYAVTDNGEFSLSDTSYLGGYCYVSGTKKSIYNKIMNMTSGNITYTYQLWTINSSIVDIKDELIGVVSSNNREAYPDNGIQDGYWYVYSKSDIQHKTTSINDISHEEGYIYPYMEITINEDGDLHIHNDLENRDTIISNCVAGEVITMDYPVIQSSVSSHNIQNDFNWIFFRIANTYENSRNDISISIPCSIKIKYSPIVKVGL